MARKGIDFSSLAAGTDLLVNGFSQTWGMSANLNFTVVADATADGGVVARLEKLADGNVYGRDAVYWNEVTGIQYSKAFFRFKVSTDGNPANLSTHQGPAVRITEELNGESALTFYGSQQNDTMAVLQYEDGVSNATSPVPFTWAEDQWVNVLIDYSANLAAGTDVIYKVWTGDRYTNESSAVTVTYPASQNQAGALGITIFRPESVYDIDFIGSCSPSETVPRSMADIDTSPVTAVGTDFTDKSAGTSLVGNGWTRGFSATTNLSGVVQSSDSSWDGGLVARFSRAINTTGREALLWDTAGSPATGAAYFRWRVTSDTMTVGSSEIQGALVQASSSAGENGVYSFLDQQADTAELAKYTDGTPSSTGSQAFTFAVGEWINILMDFESSFVTMSVWKGSDRNAEGTAMSFSLSARPAGGIGIAHFNYRVVQELDFIGFAATAAECPRSMADLGGTGPTDPDVVSSDLTFGPTLFDGCNLHPDNSSITNPSAVSPVCLMAPRATNGSFYHTLAHITGLSGKNPDFQIDCNNYVGGASVGPNWRPWYTTTDPSDHTTTWTRWPSAPVETFGGSGIYQFSLGSTFSESEIWIGFQIGYPVGRSLSVRDWLKNNHSSIFRDLPSGGTNSVIGYIASTTDELGRTIPQVPVYGYGLWSDNMPLDGKAKRNAVLLGGTHAGEHMGDYTMEGFIKWLVAGSAQANSLLRNFKFFVYPCLNPSGRWGGYRRSSPTSTVDPNRDFDAAPTLPETIMITDAWSSDIGPLNDSTVDTFMSWHGSYLTGEESSIHAFYLSDLATKAGNFETILDTYQPTRFQSSTTTGVAARYFFDFYNTGHTYTIETAERHPVSGASDYTAAGENIGKSLDDLWDQYPADFNYAGDAAGVTAGIKGEIIKRGGITQTNQIGVQVAIIKGSLLTGTIIYYTATATTDSVGKLSDIDLSSTSVLIGDTVTIFGKFGYGEGWCFELVVGDIAS